MRNIGNFLRALARALKATVLVPVIVGDEIIGWVMRSLGGAAPDTQETIEVSDATAEVALQAVEDKRRDREREQKRGKLLEASIGHGVKNACAIIDSGGVLHDRFFEGCAEEPWILAWVRSLDEGHRLSIASMTSDAVLAHIKGLREQIHLPSYREFDRLAADERVAAQTESRRTMGWSAHNHFYDMLEDVIERGEVDYVCQFDLWIEAQRRAGVPADEMDYAAA
ncbi:hypothetical protein [Aurantimonas sp. HBX-1]|uniref:hypothetical protein n=1 Tax=Aurantimonas sp. HBX-1 TaxID=2906072 RepID=UPI001F36B7C7|nr:hypothetical protein [Aurantimonas sp. HBX-1]UIJ73472.1 hypothetical protein LXB15_07520 [Aurantimonas sp. HBX-1]